MPEPTLEPRLHPSLSAGSQVLLAFRVWGEVHGKARWEQDRSLEDREEMVGVGCSLLLSPCMSVCSKIQNQQPTDTRSRILRIWLTVGGSDKTGLSISPRPLAFPRTYQLVISGLKQVSCVLSHTYYFFSRGPTLTLEWRWEVELERGASGEGFQRPGRGGRESLVPASRWHWCCPCFCMPWLPAPHSSFHKLGPPCEG